MADTRQQQRYRIDSTDKAKEFYAEFLREKEIERRKAEPLIEIQEEDLAMIEKVEGAVGGIGEYKDQCELRSTRAYCPTYKV